MSEEGRQLHGHGSCEPDEDTYNDDDDEVFEPDRNFLDAFNWFNFFLKKNVIENLTKTPYFLFVIKKDCEIEMLWNSHFGFNHEIKMSRNANFGKKNREIFMQ